MAGCAFSGRRLVEKDGLGFNDSGQLVASRTADILMGAA